MRRFCLWLFWWWFFWRFRCLGLKLFLREEPPGGSGEHWGHLEARRSLSRGWDLLGLNDATHRPGRLGQLPFGLLSDRVGRKRVIGVARRLGVRSPLKSHPSLAHGASEVTLMEMTGAYAAMAADVPAKRTPSRMAIAARNTRVLRPNAVTSASLITETVNA